ncbi:hypothetical protein QUF82_08000, partial [Thiotrichales bacterium HSG14]|nr:hypothetical protein [Thiotrichales bacterium HSG14]
GEMPGGTPPGGEMPGGTPPGGEMPGGTPPGGEKPGGTPPGGEMPGGTPPGGEQPGGSFYQPGGEKPGGTPPGGEQPGGSFYQPGGEKPGGTPPGGEKPGGTPPGGEMPGGTPPGGEMPGGTPPGGEMPGGTPPGGEMPGGTPPGGEMPGGTPPGGEMPGGTPPGGEQPGGSFYQPGGEKPGGTPPGGEIPGGTPPGGEKPGGTPPSGEQPGGMPPGGEMPGGTPPSGEQPGGMPPGGEMPGGTPPEGEQPGGMPPGGTPPSGEMPSGEMFYQPPPDHLPECSAAPQPGEPPCKPPKLEPCPPGHQPDGPTPRADTPQPVLFQGQECQPRLEDMGIKPQKMERFDNLKPQEIRGFGPQHIKDVPPKAFKEIGAEQFKEMPREALGAMTPKQFDEVSPEAMGGLEAYNMGGLPPEVIHNFGPEHLGQLDSEQFQGMPGNGISKMLVNLNPESVNPDDVKPLLPEGWQMGDECDLKPPPGTKLALPLKQPKESLLSQVKLPELPDASKCFGLGGKAPEGKSMLDGLNQGLDKAGFPQFKFQQRENGFLSVEGDGAKLSFAPDAGNMTQTTEDTPVGVSQDEGGRYIVTTPDRQQFPMIPSLYDPEGLSKAIGDESRIDMGEQGDLLIEIPEKGRHHVCVPNPFVEKAPEDLSPGVHFKKTLEGKEEARIVYEDGTMQQMHPAVRTPHKFVETGEKIDGVEKITHREDGTFEVIFNGMPIHLRPTFDVQSEPLAEGEQVKPNITLMFNNTLEYTIQEGNELLKMNLEIEYPE